MNETKRRTSPRLTFSVLWVASCLLGGFAIGSKVHTPWKTTKISFQALSWLSRADETRLAQLPTPELEAQKLPLEVEFTPFKTLTLGSFRPERLAFRSFRRAPQNWKHLSQAVVSAQRAQVLRHQERLTALRVGEHSTANLEELQRDYRLAAFELKQDFTLALVPRIQTATPQTAITQNDSEAKPTPEQFLMTQSSALLSEKTSADSRSSMHPVNMQKTEHVGKMRVTKGSKKERKSWSVQIPSGLSIQEARVLQETLQAEQLKKWDARIQTEPALPPRARSGTSSAMSALNAADTKDASKETSKKTGDVTSGATLLASSLLTPHSSAHSSATPAKPLWLAQTKPNPTSYSTQKTAAEPHRPQPNKQDEVSTAKQTSKADTVDEISTGVASFGPLEVGSSCEQLDQTRFINPMGIQVCPSRHEWITTSGWIRTHFQDSLPTLSLYPAPHSGSTLLLDTNSVALLGVKNGASYIRGMGLVVGTLPEGYEVSYSGRSEEPEYFEVQSRKYFAILNAEPGAGVITLTHSTSQEKTTTVFSPVLEGTITYLDLIEPVQTQFGVRVTKGDSKQVDRLRLGISTRGEMDAITRGDGRALFRGIYLMPGYPSYVDVSSKYRSQVGPNYRYLLQARDRQGQYLLQQQPEEKLYRWIGQLGPMGPNEGLIYGEFDRKKWGGFRHHYTVHLKMLSPQSNVVPAPHTILWNDELSQSEPLEGDLPRFVASQIPEGLALIQIKDENQTVKFQDWFPISPRVIHVISQ
jgi:hypothetical protein